MRWLVPNRYLSLGEVVARYVRRDALLHPRPPVDPVVETYEPIMFRELRADLADPNCDPAELEQRAAVVREHFE